VTNRPVRNKPVVPSQGLNDALRLHQQGKLEEAALHYAAILKAQPRHFDAMHMLGVVRSQQGRHAEALDKIQSAVELQPSDADALSNLGLLLGKLGRPEEALASYDKALAIRPDFAEVLYSRGNALKTLKRTEEALASYDKALKIRPNYAEALNNRGVALHDLKRPEEALASYDKGLAIRPGHAEALNNRGAALQDLKRPEEALASYDKALAIWPDHAEALNNRGIALRDLLRPEEALASYDKALAVRPGYAEALNNRGLALRDLKRPEEALASYDKALAIRSDYAEALNNRGTALRDLMRPEEALASYDKALAIRPDYAEAAYNRGNTLQNLGRPEEALASYDKALAIRPDYAEALNNRGTALRDLMRPEEALASYDKALAIRPDYAEALYNRGVALCDQGNLDAIAHFERALEVKPDLTTARIGMCMAQLPVLYRDESEIAARRAAYGESIDRLCADVAQGRVPGDLAEAIGSSQPFYLAYQGQNDRDLQSRYGALACRSMEGRYPPALLPPRLRPREKVRVGIVSGFFRHHTVWKLMIRGWLGQLDRAKFEVFGYHTQTRRDRETEAAAEICHRFMQGPLPLARWREEILADAPHVLIYPEIGMDIGSAQLGAQRLAPVQCVSWGHPNTTGYPTLDYFVSSALMEPPDGQDHYTERLIRLPNLSIYYEPVEFHPVTLDRAELGLRPAATVFWSGQSLFKYLPQFDEVFPRIARQVGNCQFVFIEFGQSRDVTALFNRRLDRAFAEFGLKASDFCVTLPRLDTDRFISAIGQSDIVLDSLGWSGGNTTLEGLIHDVPIVTMPGRLMRGRHTAAILQMMGVTETIADTIDDYVEIAVRLARDLSWRNAVRHKIAETKHRVYRDRECIAALENFLCRVARGEVISESMSR
jgi:protein O-GlcNAc transferase